MTERYGEAIAVRMSPAELGKLRKLANGSSRTMSQVVRALLKQAELTPHGGLRLKAKASEE